MTDAADRSLPEPLRSFRPLASVLQPRLVEADAIVARYRQAAEGAGLSAVLDAIRIEFTYQSNAIEGNTLTLRETQLVIEGRSPAGEKPMRELYEARNHDRAIRLLDSTLNHRPTDEPIRERDLLDVHAAVLADIDNVSAGRYRAGRVLIAGTNYVPPGPHKFDTLMPALLAYAAAIDVHPLLRAAELHYNLVAVHPFVDGNGRTARLMASDLVRRHGYPYLIIDAGRRGEYLGALDEANAGRLEPFARFVIESAITSLGRVVGS